MYIDMYIYMYLLVLTTTTTTNDINNKQMKQHDSIAIVYLTVSQLSID